MCSFSHEYDIYNAVSRAAYKLPDDFPPLTADIVRNLIVLEPSERLGSEETGGMAKLKLHPFFSQFSYDTKWGKLLDQRSPLEAKEKLSSRPKLSNDEVNMHYQISLFFLSRRLLENLCVSSE